MYQMYKECMYREVERAPSTLETGIYLEIDDEGV